MSKLAVVRIRGTIGSHRDVKLTFQNLHLLRQNYCAVLENTPTNLGMIKKVKDYVTWGEIDDALYNEIVAGKGEEYKGPVQDSKGKISYNKFVEVNGKKYKKFFRLNPPQKGYGRGGIKVPFSKGGALGNRGDKIADLIKRML